MKILKNLMLAVVVCALAIFAGAPAKAQTSPAVIQYGQYNVIASAPSIITATTYTVGTADTNLTFNGTAACTVTLPTATAGRVLFVRTIAAYAINSASSNVDAVATNTPGTSILTATAGKWAILVGDGTNWEIIAAN